MPDISQFNPKPYNKLLYVIASDSADKADLIPSQVDIRVPGQKPNEAPAVKAGEIPIKLYLGLTGTYHGGPMAEKSNEMKLTELVYSASKLTEYSGTATIFCLAVSEEKFKEIQSESSLKKSLGWVNEQREAQRRLDGLAITTFPIQNAHACAEAQLFQAGLTPNDFRIVGKYIIDNENVSAKAITNMTFTNQTLKQEFNILVSNHYHNQICFSSSPDFQSSEEYIVHPSANLNATSSHM